MQTDPKQSILLENQKKKTISCPFISLRVLLSPPGFGMSARFINEPDEIHVKSISPLCRDGLRVSLAADGCGSCCNLSECNISDADGGGG